jgi:RNA polymerase sigma factor (sigma-70 family)
MPAPEYFESALPVVEDVIAFHCSRGRLAPEEREDFHSWAICKLIENDYARIRTFEGRSSFRSFLSVIVGHLLVDYWASKSGRRRLSSTAQTFAPEGLWLERYLRRGHTVSEAIQLVRSNHGSPLSEDELYHITIRLPLTRKRPTYVPESAGVQVGSVNASPERLIEEKAEDRSRAQLEAVLEQALARLSSDERVFVRMRFEDGSRINEIAKAFHIPEKAFYRRFQRTLRRLRKALKAAGLDSECLDLYREEGEQSANFRTLAV